ncbi:hypothetical protein WKH56_19735 [Priestia sp. SB1]|uniref:hypothetical protein n=1 Tax=Priestia sp. SB1 TaxID=3132359 RepID=UPI003181E3A7
MHKYYIFYNYYTEKEPYTRNTKEGMFNLTTDITHDNYSEVLKKAEKHLARLLEESLDEKVNEVKIIKTTCYKEPQVLATLEC